MFRSFAAMAVSSISGPISCNCIKLVWWNSSYIYVYKNLNVLMCLSRRGRHSFVKTGVHKECAVVTSPGYGCCSQMMAVVSSCRAAVQRPTMSLFEALSPVWTLLCCLKSSDLLMVAVLCCVLHSLRGRPTAKYMSALIFCQIRALTQNVLTGQKKSPLWNHLYLLTRDHISHC